MAPSVAAYSPAPASPTAAVSPSISTSLSAAPPTFCPGRTWPPYKLGGIPGITAISTDRATIEITNITGQTWYYRVSGWGLDQFETCRALGEVEVQRGPIAGGATERVMLQGNWEQMNVPMTIAFWEKPCGEACRTEPIAAMQVVRSPLEPAASWPRDALRHARTDSSATPSGPLPVVALSRDYPEQGDHGPNEKPLDGCRGARFVRDSGSGEPAGIRTLNLVIKSHLLYR